MCHPLQLMLTGKREAHLLDDTTCHRINSRRSFRSTVDGPRPGISEAPAMEPGVCVSNS